MLARHGRPVAVRRLLRVVERARRQHVVRDAAPVDGRGGRRRAGTRGGLSGADGHGERCGSGTCAQVHQGAARRTAAHTATAAPSNDSFPAAPMKPLDSCTDLHAPAPDRMTATHVRLEIAEGIARITLDRPDVLNSFDRPMAAELQAALAQVAADDAVRAVLLTGAGRAFCAGQDLAAVLPQAGAPPLDLGDIVRDCYNPIVRALRALEKPVVAAVNGVAAGAGANLALACDFVIAVETASFVQSFAHIGLIPDSGGTFVLPRLVGLARATQLAMLGEKLPARQALEWGMIYQVVEAAQLDETATALARRLAAHADARTRPRQARAERGPRRRRSTSSSRWRSRCSARPDAPRTTRRACRRSSRSGGPCSRGAEREPLRRGHGRRRRRRRRHGDRDRAGRAQRRAPRRARGRAARRRARARSGHQSRPRARGREGPDGGRGGERGLPPADDPARGRGSRRRSRSAGS